MSQGTLTLYRKYRPAGFDDLVGQEAVVQGLQAAVVTGRVAHAYLFAGPRGTGKTSAARILAKCLNCQTNGPRPDPCGICEACTSIAAGTSFDVVEIDAASNRGISEIRELRERVKFAPANFRKKVYIVDEVHMLTPEAFNALLKTLEEPPDYVVFVLATTEQHKVPATILSRCQRYEFRRVTPGDIAARLTDVARAEGIKITAGAAARIAYLADGALRDALVLLEQARGFTENGSIDDATLDAAFGASHRELVEGVVDAVAASDAGKALTAIAAASAAGVDPSWLAKECVRWFRLALLALVSRDLLDDEVAPELAKSVGDRAALLGRVKVLAALRHLSECVTAQRFSSQPRIDLELALARVIMPADELSLSMLSDRLRLLEELVRAGAAGPASPASASPAPKKPHVRNTGEQAKLAPVSNASLSAARLAGLWPMVLTAAKERSVQAYGHLQHATVTESTDGLITIRVDDKFNRDQLAESRMTEVVVEAIAQASGARPQVRFELSQSPAAKATARGHAAGLALAADVLGDDLI